MRQSAITYIAAGTVLFLSGMLVGAQTKRNSLSKYERAYNFQVLDWGIIRANLTLLRSQIEVPKELSPEFEVPTIYFDRKARQVRVYSLIDGAAADKMTAEDLKSHLMNAVFGVLGVQ